MGEGWDGLPIANSAMEERPKKILHQERCQDTWYHLIEYACIFFASSMDSNSKHACTRSHATLTYADVLPMANSAMEETPKKILPDSLAEQLHKLRNEINMSQIIQH